MFHSKLFWVYVLQCQPQCHCRWHVITWCCSSCVAIKTDPRFGPATIDTCWCHPSDVLFLAINFQKATFICCYHCFQKSGVEQWMTSLNDPLPFASREFSQEMMDQLTNTYQEADLQTLTPGERMNCWRQLRVLVLVIWTWKETMSICSIPYRPYTYVTIINSNKADRLSQVWHCSLCANHSLQWNHKFDSDMGWSSSKLGL